MSYLDSLKRRLKKTASGDQPRDLGVVKVCCPQCGTCSEVNLDEDPDENWLGCVAPNGFEWALPTGKIMPVIGEAQYTDSLGNQYTRKSYREKYNIDPEVAYTKMRASIQKNCSYTH